PTPLHLAAQTDKPATCFARKHENPQACLRGFMKKRTPLSFPVEKMAPATEPLQKTGLQPNTQTHKHANTQPKQGREGRQFIAAHVLPEAAKQFKLLAVQHEKTTQDMLIEAINDLFTKYGLSRIA